MSNDWRTFVAAITPAPDPPEATDTPTDHVPREATADRTTTPPTDRRALLRALLGNH